MNLHDPFPVIPYRMRALAGSLQKPRNEMQCLEHSEHYSDKGQYGVVTRTKVLSHSQLTRIASHLCGNAEDLALSTNPPALGNCRTAGAMLGWALSLEPISIGMRFDY